MQCSWQPIKREHSTYIPQHIPSGSIFSGLLPQYGCHETETHAKQSVPWWKLAKLLNGFGRTGIGRFLRHSALLPERWVLSSSWMPGALPCWRPSGLLRNQIFPGHAPREYIKAKGYVTLPRDSCQVLTLRKTENGSWGTASANKLLKMFNECGHHPAAEAPLGLWVLWSGSSPTETDTSLQGYHSSEGKRRVVKSCNVQIKDFIKSNAAYLCWRDTLTELTSTILSKQRVLHRFAENLLQRTQFAFEVNYYEALYASNWELWVKNQNSAWYNKLG